MVLKLKNKKKHDLVHREVTIAWMKRMYCFRENSNFPFSNQKNITLVSVFVLINFTFVARCLYDESL
jgi:hypothetical protein